MSPRSVPDIEAAARFIHSTIVVTMATATTEEHCDGHRDCCGDAKPHPFEGVAALRLHQERHQNRDNDRGLKTLAQTDQTASEQLRCDVGRGGVNTDAKVRTSSHRVLATPIHVLYFGLPKQGVAHLIKSRGGRVHVR
jgi:hypothetical protein